MSPGADDGSMIGVSWGSSNFRAYCIAADGSALDEYAVAAGVAGLDRAGMAAIIASLAERWPGGAPVYLSGMIGSNVGWIDVPYAEVPIGADGLAAAAVATTIGNVAATIVPGVTCRRELDGTPDILRGEEIELVGLAALGHGDGIVALPGTHTKWVRLAGGRIGEFFTSMSGEIFDRLTTNGLLASIVAGEACDGSAFLDDVAAGRARQIGLGTLLFGARARVIRGDLARTEAASYIRGLLIGSEIADAETAFALGGARMPLVGNGPLSRLYASALATIGIETELVDSRVACLAGFRALHQAAYG